MKKTIKLLSILLTVCIAFALVACEKTSDDSSSGELSKECAIVVSLSIEGEAMTLLAYMQDLMAKGELEFESEVSSGMTMITSVNGLKNAGSSYWMLYTDDSENSNLQWGSYEYDGRTLGSASLGADTLVVKDGGVYVWAYQTF